MIPIEWLWYIIGAISVPVFIIIFMKTLKRNREDKDRVALRRRRFEEMMKAPDIALNRKFPKRAKSTPMSVPATDRIESTDRTATTIEKPRAVENPATGQTGRNRATGGIKRVDSEKEIKSRERIPAEDPAPVHWLREVKLPNKRQESSTTDSGHWLEYLRAAKRSRHWLDNLRR